jgi:uncharacterized spore protein YtfJ
MNRFRTTTIHADSRLALIAVESLERRYEKSESGCWLHGVLKPAAVIVCNTDGAHVIGIEEGFDNIDLLIEDIPELKSMIDSLISKWN